jgi:hypothetical protein
MNSYQVREAKMNTPHPLCVFCNRADNKPSREELLPNWIANELPHNRWNVVVRTQPSDRNKPAEVIRRFKTQKTLGIAIKRPCERCNNNWMSALEQRAKPLLTPMMHGKSITLDHKEQRIIVRWLLKTAMVIDLHHGKNNKTYFSQQERHALMKTGYIPHHTAVFLARYHGSHQSAIRELRLPVKIEAPGDNGPTSINSYTVTLAVRNLALQMFTLRWPKERQTLRVTFSDAWKPAIVQLVRSEARIARWPPIQYFDDSGFEDFASRFDEMEFPS